MITMETVIETQQRLNLFCFVLYKASYKLRPYELACQSNMMLFLRLIKFSLNCFFQEEFIWIQEEKGRQVYGMIFCSLEIYCFHFY